MDKIKEGEEEIDLLCHMQKLEIKDGDIIVVFVSVELSESAGKNLADLVKRAIQNAGHNNVSVMVLEEGMSIGVLSKKGS